MGKQGERGGLNTGFQGLRTEKTDTLYRLLKRLLELKGACAGASPLQPQCIETE